MKVDKILNELRNGTPLKKIKETYQSQSQLYEAFRLYFAQAEGKIEERQNTLSALASQQTSLEQKIKQLDVKANELKSSKDKLQLDLGNLEGTIKEKRWELDGIEKKLSELAKIGVTVKLVTRIHGMELESGEDLLERVKSAAGQTAVKTDLADLMKEKTRITEEIAGLTKTREGLNSDIQSQKNLLDEWMRKTQTFQKAMKITVSFFLDGYDTQDLERLKDGLKLLGVKGHPALSIDRLVRGLEDAKTLVNLKNTIREDAKQLDSLNANIDVVKGELESYKAIVLKVLNEAKDEAIREIMDIGKHALSETEKLGIKYEKNIEDMGKLWEKELKAVNQMALNSLSKANMTMDGIIKTLNTGTDRALNQIDSHISDTMKQFKADFEKATKLKEEAMKYEHLMKTAYCLLGVLKFPEAIKEVPLPLIAQLMDRVHMYIETLFGDEWTRPSKTVCNKESGLSEYRSYRLPALSLWLKEELEKRTLERAKKMTAGD